MILNPNLGIALFATVVSFGRLHIPQPLLPMLAAEFSVYASILNLIPFRLMETDASLSPLIISSLYTGYLVGMPIAFYSQQLENLLSDERLGLTISLGMIGIALLSYLFPDFGVLFTMMFLFAGGFFFIHATLSWLVARHGL